MSDPRQLLIQPATTPRDLDRIRILFRAYAGHLRQSPTGAAGICIPDFEREIAALPAPYSLLLLATVDDTPAGCVALKPLATKTTEQACELKRLWVADGFRGLGMGRKLVEAVIKHARSIGHTACYLDTVPAAMPEANRLYAALGFVAIARYNDNPVRDVVFFRRDL